MKYMSKGKRIIEIVGTVLVLLVFSSIESIANFIFH